MKKVVISFFALVMAVFMFDANAQFGKNLKKVGKSIGKVAGDVAGDIAADMAANQVAANIVVFMDNNNNVSADDSEYTKRLASIVSPNLVSVDGLELNYKVYESPEANILACANGCIRVYSGLMDVLTDNELAAVIATQIGHIVNKDTRDALMKVATEENAGNAASAQLEKMLSFSGDKLGSIVNELIQVPYTDEQNKAADKYAVKLLKAKKIDSEALYTALEKFAAMEENDKKAEQDEEGELEFSPASKYLKVSSNNNARASLVRSM